ncbi:MAG: tRNA (adenosine(37)-N6)-threonylcarbamoyltransferase complex ATPase subunit type 1 TsaE [Verrucomicrobia bacterium]|nr:tRNA (adenosine(37)-N6)-threonylcarbamoyltransferase complex ATPase subunit type 1 TsaE [Verrucomicrobiota bacterium]
MRSESVADTLVAGRAVGEACTPGTILALCGDLGAGKTHFVKGVCQGLGADAEVTSPTFTLLHEYRGGRLPVFHFDLYRLASAEEALGLGFDDYLEAGGVCVLEWADKFPELLPEGTRWFDFRLAPDGAREIVER